MVNAAGLIDVRVHYAKDGDVQVLESQRFLTPCVPRVGDGFDLGDEFCMVTGVEWFVHEHQPCVTIWITPEND